MKKVLFFAVIVLCAFSCVRAQDIVNLRMDRQQMGLRGPVASMDEDQLLRKDYFREDWPQRKWFVKDLRNVLREEEGRIVTFNPAGRMVTVTYTHQGRMGAKTVCEYAPNGLLTAFSGEGYKIEAKYNGNMADINVYAETKSYAGNVDIARANLSGAAYTYTYPFDLKCRQELGDDGIVLSSSYFYVDSLLARECMYDYNHNNLLTSEKTIDYTSGEKTVSITKYTYDNRGFLVKKVINSKAVDATFTYENNEFGDCTKMTVERPYGTVVYTFEYQYDNQNNWTVRLEYEDGVFDNATLRSFTYHKEPAKKDAVVKKNGKKSNKNLKVADAQVAKNQTKADVKQHKAAEKEAKAAEKKAAKERAAAEKAAKKEAEAQKKAAAKAEQQRIAEEEKNMTKEERKAAQEARKTAEKQRKAMEKAAAKEKAAAEKAAKEQAKAAEKAAKEQAKAAEKAAKEKAKVEDAQRKAAEKERKAQEKAAAKEKAAAEKAAKAKQ